MPAVSVAVVMGVVVIVRVVVSVVLDGMRAMRTEQVPVVPVVWVRVNPASVAVRCRGRCTTHRRKVAVHVLPKTAAIHSIDARCQTRIADTALPDGQEGSRPRRIARL